MIYVLIAGGLLVVIVMLAICKAAGDADEQTERIFRNKEGRVDE